MRCCYCYWFSLLILQPQRPIHSFLHIFCPTSKIGKPSISLSSEFSENASTSSIIPPVFHHHTSIRSSNIEISIKFYSLLGFQIECKFRSGPARSVWLIIPNPSPSKQTRIEVIEVPSYMLSPSPSKAIDVVNHPTHMGYNHLALDVTNSTTSLEEWIETINSTSYRQFQKTIRIAIPIQTQLIGSNVYDVGWIYDADGAVIELLYWKSHLNQKVESGWEPWNGEGFVE